jgi:uncharacterized membrane protein (DUF2068 family)
MASRARNVLPWIVAFKAFKSLSLCALGIALLATRHADPVDALFQFALAIHLPVSSRLFDRALAWVTGLTVTKETALGITALAYAALMGTEGIGLYLRKGWARWFTIIATGSLVPVEIYEVARALRPVRVLVLAANLAIVVYLWRRKEVFD